MDRTTVRVYEASARSYALRRAPESVDRARALAATVPPGGHRIDLGCGPGLSLSELGRPVVALDAAASMLEAAGERAPWALGVQADLEALPFRPGSLAGAWASKCYHHLPAGHLPMALADLHAALGVGAPLCLGVPSRGEPADVVTGEDDDFPGRLFAALPPDRLADVVTGAGFEVESVDVFEKGGRIWVWARRARSLADTVGPGMRLLVCGLNPSLWAADAGVAYARPGNRFWPAALAAGLLTRDRRPRHALGAYGVGMSDLVKRATASAAEISAGEYRAGLARVARLCDWLRPASVCLVGLAGWRAAALPGAVAGPQPQTLGGSPLYVMPSTSGANAHAGLPELTAHLRAAMSLGGYGPKVPPA